MDNLRGWRKFKQILKICIYNQVLLASPSVIQAEFLLGWPWILQMRMYII